jgi:excisionase family DNA binding protein
MDKSTETTAPRYAPRHPKYGTLAAWCAYVGYSRSTCYELIKEGKLRAVKLGGRTLIDFEQGLAMMAELPSVHEAKKVA